MNFKKNLHRNYTNIKDKSKGFLGRLYEELNDDRIFDGSAAIAFYATLATFPALIALVAIVPYLPVQGFRPMLSELLNNNFPSSASKFIMEIAGEVASNKRPDLISTGFVTAIWIASTAMSTIVNQLNVVNNVKETRGYISQRIICLGLTGLYLVAVIISASLIIMSENLNEYIHLILNESFFTLIILNIIKYIVIFSLLISACSSIFYFAPNKEKRLRWLTPGSLTTVILIIFASILFDFYISNFGSYDRMYGSIAGIVVYMLWLYVLGFSILVGAKVNLIHYNSDAY